MELDRTHLLQKDDSDLNGTAKASVRIYLRAGVLTLRHSGSMKEQNGRNLPTTVPAEVYKLLAKRHTASQQTYQNPEATEQESTSQRHREPLD